MNTGRGLHHIAKLVLWLGILWNVAWVVFALLAFESDQRFSDAISDAMPRVLLGAFGFCLAFVISWGIEGFIRKQVGRTETDTAGERKAGDGGREK